MNREIKFRGQRKDTKEWVYGFFIQDATSKTVYIENYVGLEFSGSNAYWEVIPETVGQFTGLKDKNGKEIYEEDIIRMSTEYESAEKIDLVRFLNGGFVVEWDNQFAGGEADSTTIGWAIEEGVIIEIIGNIHENSKLIHP